MKQVCLHCAREASIGSLWCQEIYCSGNDKPMILEYGESLSDIKIAEVRALLYTSVIYEAERGGEKVLLKVAHDNYDGRLKQEADFLMQLQERKISHPALPILLPAHKQAKLKNYPYGKTVVKSQTKYYTVYKFISGEPLRDVLLKDPQPWYQFAGWLVLGLADVVALMHQYQRLHLCISPESVLVRFDKEGIPRPHLLDLGVVAQPKTASKLWSLRFVPPAYVAPELLNPNGGRIGAFTDVYSVGLILHEMLAGKPAYQFRLRTNGEVYQDVMKAPPSILNRPDLKEIPQITSRAISKDYRRRQPAILNLARDLQTNLPPVPKEKKPRRIPWRTIGVIIAGALAVAILLVLAASLSQLTAS